MSAKKVLVVDDEASIREMLRLALEISEFECLEAADMNDLALHLKSMMAESEH